MARKIICYLPGEAVRAIVPYDENPPASNFIPSFPASTSTFPWGKKKKPNNYNLLWLTNIVDFQIMNNIAFFSSEYIDYRLEKTVIPMYMLSVVIVAKQSKIWPTLSSNCVIHKLPTRAMCNTRACLRLICIGLLSSPVLHSSSSPIVLTLNCPKNPWGTLFLRVYTSNPADLQDKDEVVRRSVADIEVMFWCFLVLFIELKFLDYIRVLQQPQQDLFRHLIQAKYFHLCKVKRSTRHICETCRYQHQHHRHFMMHGTYTNV